MNVSKVTGEITDLWGNREFAYRLKVPDQKKKEIQLKFPTIKEQREQLIIYWMDWDPRASWRGMIVTLDGLNKTKLADTIRGYAEPILGKSHAQQKWYSQKGILLKDHITPIILSKDPQLIKDLIFICTKQFMGPGIEFVPSVLNI